MEAFLVLLYFCTVVSAIITWSTDSSIVTRGSTVSFSCTTDSSDRDICWKYEGNTNTTKVFEIADDRGLYNKYRHNFSLAVNGNPATSVLTINSVHLTDAGVYTCYECFYRSQKCVNLTAFDCDVVLPSCLKENITIQIRCNVKYPGHIPPLIRCRFPSLNDTRAYIESETLHVSTTSEMSYKGTVFASHIMEGHVISCYLGWTESQSSNNTIWTSKEIHLASTDGPQNMSIQQQDGKLACSADGTPQPTYQWITDNIEVNGSVFSLVDYCNDSASITVTCVSTVICDATVTTKNETKNFTCSGHRATDNTSSGKTITVVVTTSGGFITIAIVIWKRQKVKTFFANVCVSGSHKKDDKHQEPLKGTVARA